MNRRFFLRGLVACPAVVAASSLMPVRGIIMPVKPVFHQHDVVWTASGGILQSISCMVVYRTDTQPAEIVWMSNASPKI